MAGKHSMNNNEVPKALKKDRVLEEVPKALRDNENDEKTQKSIRNNEADEETPKAFQNNYQQELLNKNESLNNGEENYEYAKRRKIRRSKRKLFCLSSLPGCRRCGR